MLGIDTDVMTFLLKRIQVRRKRFFIIILDMIMQPVNMSMSEYIRCYWCSFGFEMFRFNTFFLSRLEFSDMTRRTEIGGYVSGHDKWVYVIRGFYTHIQPESVSFS